MTVFDKLNALFDTDSLMAPNYINIDWNFCIFIQKVSIHQQRELRLMFM